MKRASGRRAVLALGLVLTTMVGAACATPPPDPDGVRGGAVLLEIGSPRFDGLDCRAGDCQDWYRVGLEEEGQLSLQIASALDVRAGGVYSLLLESGTGQAIDSVQAGPGSQGLSRRLQPGFYLVGLKAGETSPAFGYTIEARFEPVGRGPDPDPSLTTEDVPTAQVAPPEEPEPVFVPVDAEILEVEGRMSAPDGILIDLGENGGAIEGLRGELLERDDFVGEIEIVDVYPEGSRARVLGGLRRPLTPSVRAVLHFPRDEDRSDDPEALPEIPESDAFPPDRD